jgi:glycosyltransferase involved in cell wall biosynthesis
MAGSDVLLLSSRHEGLPTVLIEAMACGCPVVATDCPSGPRTILAGGTYGPLVDVGDDSGLADAVLSTLAEPPTSGTLVDRARDFAPETVLDDYESFLRDHGPIRTAHPPGA